MQRRELHCGVKRTVCGHFLAPIMREENPNMHLKLGRLKVKCQVMNNTNWFASLPNGNHLRVMYFEGGRTYLDKCSCGVESVGTGE